MAPGVTDEPKQPACGSPFHAYRWGIPGWYVIKRGTDQVAAGPFLDEDAAHKSQRTLKSDWLVMEVKG